MNDFNKVLGLGMFAGGTILGLSIIKKLNDIHEEIKYFERQKDIWYSKKENDKRLERMFSNEDEEA